MWEVLFADDDPAMRRMVADLLQAAGFDVRLAPDGRAALQEIHRDPPDLAVLDYRMGNPDGFAVCSELKRDPRLEHVPVLILTAQGRVDERVRGFDAGADDFLAKPFDPRELVARCRALLRLARQGLDRNPTTGLPGSEALGREIERRSAAGEPFSLCYLDLDHFKPFSDRFGFATADEVIRMAGQALRDVEAGGNSFIAHVGGDDFVLMTDAAGARSRVAETQARFTRALELQLPPEITAAGRYAAKDREGREREFPLTRLSAAIVHVGAHWGGSRHELGTLIAEAKRSAKESVLGIVEVRVPPLPG